MVSDAVEPSLDVPVTNELVEDAVAMVEPPEEIYVGYRWMKTDSISFGHLPMNEIIPSELFTNLGTFAG